MRIVGILALVAGLLLAAFALSMDVSVHVEAQNFGYGLRTPAMDVVNADKMATRQNLLIFSGILAVVGAILTGFGTVNAAQSRHPQQTGEKSDGENGSTICPNCLRAGDAEASHCAKCGTALEPA